MRQYILRKDDFKLRKFYSNEITQVRELEQNWNEDEDLVSCGVIPSYLKLLNAYQKPARVLGYLGQSNDNIFGSTIFTVTFYLSNVCILFKFYL